jgi:hypothetical protein
MRVIRDLFRAPSACDMSRRRFGAFLFISAMLVGGCSKETEVAWTEEVKLVGGTVINVKRKAEFKAPAELGQPSGESWYSLDFEHPTTREPVHVESALRAGGAEMEEAAQSKRLLMQWPVSLMVDKNDLFLVTRSHAQFHRYLLCPDPPYQLYKWASKHWEWKPLSEIPVRKFNHSFFDAQGKRARDFLKSHDYHLDVKASNEFSGPRATYDLTGMTQVSYASTRYCTRDIEWIAKTQSSN